MPTSGCTYETAGARCAEGYLVSPSNNLSLIDVSTQARKRCPSCNTLPSMGGVIDIPYKTIGDQTNQPWALRFVVPDTKALEYTGQDLKTWAHELYAAATGKDKNINSNKNFNSELSILYATEGQQDVLRKIKEDIEPNVRRSAEILSELFLGDSAQGVVVDLGQDFILASKAELLNMKKLTDELGLSAALDIDGQLAQISSGGNEAEIKRTKVILSLVYILHEDANEAVARFELDRPIRSLNMSASDIVKLILENYNKQKEDQTNGIETSTSGLSDL